MRNWKPQWAIEAEQRNLSWGESKALYMKNFYAEQRERARKAAEKKPEKRSAWRKETIAQRVQRENRERVLKLMSRRYDPYLED